jgi:catechol 2,3-dioxygenase-like lactoylglutathione lyase family enzyme
MIKIMYDTCYPTIIVSDLERSVDFYKRLGFEKIQVGDSTEGINISYLRNGNVILQLTGGRGLRAAEHKHSGDYSVGINDIGLTVDSVEDTLRDLIRKGVVSEDTEIMEPGDGLRFFKLEDPDGVLIGILEDKRKIKKI